MVCSWVCLNRLLVTTLSSASRLSSITTPHAVRSDSSRMSLMPSSFLSRTRSAVASIHRDLLTMNGSSVTTIAGRSLRTSSTWATPRHDHRAAPVAVSPTGCRPGPGINAAGGEVRAGDELDELVVGHPRIGDSAAARRRSPRRGCGRDVGRHADGDADEPLIRQVRDLGRQDRGLELLVRRSWAASRTVSLSMSASSSPESFAHPALGVAHGRRRSAVDPSRSCPGRRSACSAHREVLGMRTRAS